MCGGNQMLARSGHEQSLPSLWAAEEEFQTRSYCGFTSSSKLAWGRHMRDMNHKIYMLWVKMLSSCWAGHVKHAHLEPVGAVEAIIIGIWHTGLLCWLLSRWSCLNLDYLWCDSWCKWCTFSAVKEEFYCPFFFVSVWFCFTSVEYYFVSSLY